jgi:hypothetical protein
MGQLTLHLLSLSTTQWGLSYQGIGLIWCSPPAVNSSEDRKIERNGANVFRTKLDRPLSNKNMTDCFQTKLDRPLSNKIESTTFEQNWIDRFRTKLDRPLSKKIGLTGFRTKLDRPLSNKIGSTVFEQSLIDRFRTKILSRRSFKYGLTQTILTLFYGFKGKKSFLEYDCGERSIYRNAT